MRSKGWWLFLGALFFAGQIVMLLLKQPAMGALISGSALVGFLAGALWHSERGLSSLLAGTALTCAIIAQSIVKSSPAAGFWLFAASGFLLVLGRPGIRPAPPQPDIPAGPAVFERWEPWFMLLLLLLAVALRVLHIHGFPFGSIAEEAQHIPVINGAVANGGYVPHFLDGNMGTPTLMSYFGYALAKLFNHSVDGFRLAPGFFGVASILVFYFTARRITSPFTAAAMTLLYASWPLHIGFSRRFYPYIVIFIPIVAGFGFWLIGMSRKHWLWFLLAGLGMGFCLHGYEAGRGAMLIFIFWWLWLALFYRRLFPSVRHLLWFGLGFSIVAAPIFYHALAHWDNYWGYVASKNPNLHHSLTGYWKQILSLVPSYLGIFHIRSDSNYTMYPIYQPILDPVMGILFGMGFFFCVSQFWRPVPAFLLAFFAAAMMPALIGGGEEHPTARRMVMAYPAIFLMGAMALERLRQSWTTSRPWLNRVLLAVLVLLAVGTTGLNVHRYFYIWGSSPEARAGFCYRAQKMVDEIRRYPQAAVRLQPLLGHEQLYVLGLDVPKTETFSTLEEYLIMNPAQDYLLFLEGYLEPALPFFQKQFPHAEIKVFRESQMDSRFTTTGAFWKLATDPFFPANYVIRMYLPKEDVAGFQSLLELSENRPPQRLPVFADTFAPANARRSLQLAGAVVLKLTGTYTFRLDWPGWRLQVDGRNYAWNAPVPLTAGIHYFTLSGQVPADRKGPLPLAIASAGNLPVEPGSVVALLPDMGMRITGREKPLQWDGPVAMQRQELFPFKRYYFDRTVPWTYSSRLSAQLTVPVTGQYEFETKSYSSCRLRVANESVFDNFKNALAPDRKPIQLQAGKPVSFQADFLTTGEILTYLVYYRGPNQRELALAPLEWFKPNFEE